MLEWQEILTPFLLVRRSCIAGKFRRAGGLTECWCLPDYMEDSAPQWVEAALGEWYKHDPQVFPSAAWMDSRRWRTSDENRLADQLEELRGKRAEVLAVMAVTADCFADLGFDVMEMNQVYPPKDRREDLQVRDPDTPGWTALVGYGDIPPGRGSTTCCGSPAPASVTCATTARTAAGARAVLIKATGRLAFMERERHGSGEVRIPERLELWNGHRPR